MTLVIGRARTQHLVVARSGGGRDPAMVGGDVYSINTKKVDDENV